MAPMDTLTIFHGVVDWLWLIDHAWFDRLCTLSKNTHSSIVCFCAAILSMHSFMHAIVETQYVSSDSIYWMSLRPQRGKNTSKRQRNVYENIIVINLELLLILVLEERKRRSLNNYQHCAIIFLLFIHTAE